MKARTASRLAWSIGTVSIAMMVAALALMFVDRGTTLPPAAASDSWSFANVLNVFVNIAGTGIGILLAWRRPDNRIGWLFLVTGSALAINVFGTAYSVHSLVVDPGSLPAGREWAWISTWTWLIGLCMISFLFLLFPTGLLQSRRWVPVAWLDSVAFVPVAGAIIFYTTEAWNHPYSHASSGAPNFLFLIVILPILAAFSASLAALVVRFRRSVGDERLQLKWFVTGAALVVASFVPGFLDTSPNLSPLVSVLQSLAFLFLFSAIAIAVLKYRLYEIDVVINKAIVYGVLAAFFTAVYLAVVVGIGAAIGSAHSPLLTVLAAALIALAFNPVRDRAKKLANRIAYGKRTTPYEVLSEFAQNMAGSHSLEDVLPRTAQMLAEGTGATRADVWLLVGSELVDEATWPTAAPLDRVPAINSDGVLIPGASLSMPVRHEGELLGAISIHKSLGDPVSAVEDKLLADLASQAGLVLRNVGLIQDLKASRQRIVTAQDAAARRLERNIHDGAQQLLVALAVKQRLAEGLVDKDAAKAKHLLSELQTDTAAALENLRDLARGIYPPLLADQGLAAALQAQARKSAVSTTVDAEGIGRYPEETEAAVYFCTLEALQNVAKYADASRATVRVSASDGHLLFSVQDDGVGFDPAAKGYGTGMQGMVDRLAALGGELRVTSNPGTGTHIEGTVPVRGFNSPSAGQPPA